MKNQCTIPGCQRIGKIKRGMCSLHYGRWLYHGSAETLIEFHGMTKTAIYHRWGSMKQRCYYSKHTYFDRYGGRGIMVCEEWRTSFATFYRDMGDPPTPKHQIDRIDNDLGYSKENCRWVLPSSNCANRSSTKITSSQAVRELRAQGLKNPEIARHFGVKTHSISTLLWRAKKETA